MDNQFKKQSEQKEEFHNSFLDGNELIEEAIANFYKENNQETFINILETIRHRMHADGHFDSLSALSSRMMEKYGRQHLLRRKNLKREKRLL